MPLRAFLGCTFVYAGLQKLADPNFLRANAASSIQTQLQAAARTSPIGGVFAPLHHVSLLVGLLVALTELAVGVATLLGLWSRVAAGVGLLLALGFLLAVSWHSRPYYLGPDIVFCFAWTPLLLAQPGPWSVDRWLRARARAEEQLPDTSLVAVAFGTVQQICGQHDDGRCRARGGAACAPARCPVLRPSDRGDLRTARRDVDFERRELLARIRLAGVVAVPAMLTGGLTAVIGRVLNHGSTRATTPSLGGTASPVRPSAPQRSRTDPTSPATTQAGRSPSPGPSATTAPPTTASGVAVGSASAVPVGGAATFTDPTSGRPALVVQPRAGQFRAFSAVCTHAGCTVAYSSSGNQFRCPCHGAIFDAVTGAVIQGPARDPLPAVNVSVRSGQLYVSS